MPFKKETEPNSVWHEKSLIRSLQIFLTLSLVQSYGVDKLSYKSYIWGGLNETVTIRENGIDDLNLNTERGFFILPCCSGLSPESISSLLSKQRVICRVDWVI